MKKFTVYPVLVLIIASIIFSGCAKHGSCPISDTKNRSSSDVYLKEYDEVLPIENGVGLIRKGELWGYYTEDRILMEPKYTQAKHFDENGFAIVSLGGMASTGLIDRNGQYVLEPQWDFVFPNSGLCFSLAKDMQWGHIDLESNTLVEPNYHYRYEFDSEGYAVVTGSELRKGIIDTKGNCVLGMVYDIAYPFIEGLSAVSLDGLWGCVNKEGEVVIPIEYERITIGDGMVVAYPYYRRYYKASMNIYDAKSHGADFLVYQYKILTYENEALFSCDQKIYQTALDFEQTPLPDLLRKPGFVPAIDLKDAESTGISLEGYRVGYEVAPCLGFDSEQSIRLYTLQDELTGFFFLADPALSKEIAVALPPIYYLSGSDGLNLINGFASFKY